MTHPLTALAAVDQWLGSVAHTIARESSKIFVGFVVPHRERVRERRKNAMRTPSRSARSAKSTTPRSIPKNSTGVTTRSGRRSVKPQTVQ